MPPVAAAYVTGTHLDNPEFVPARLEPPKSVSTN
jgi:hypothetical protein